MKTNKKRSRFGVVAIGALVGSVLSVGVATSDVSAKSVKTEQEAIVIEVDDAPTVKFNWPVYSSLRSGIRW